MITEMIKNDCDTFVCITCEYSTPYQSNYNRHLKTEKHKKKEKIQNDIKNDLNEKVICECGKSYNHRSNYYRHKKNCKFINKDQIHNTTDYKEMFIQMLNQNKDLQELLISQQQEYKKEQQEYKKEQKEVINKYENLILHIKPNHTISNCNNKTINNNNNHVNIMMFLNDKCKDAMTIQDFAERLVVSIEDLEKKKFDCLTNTILKNLKSLAITERPVHCGNIKRKEWGGRDPQAPGCAGVPQVFKR
jgi:hypothetical protein